MIPTGRYIEHLAILTGFTNVWNWRNSNWQSRPAHLVTFQGRSHILCEDMRCIDVEVIRTKLIRKYSDVLWRRVSTFYRDRNGKALHPCPTPPHFHWWHVSTRNDDLRRYSHRMMDSFHVYICLHMLSNSG